MSGLHGEFLMPVPSVIETKAPALLKIDISQKTSKLPA
jgi:hypothetical protein